MRMTLLATAAGAALVAVGQVAAAATLVSYNVNGTTGAIPQVAQPGPVGIVPGTLARGPGLGDAGGAAGEIKGNYFDPVSSPSAAIDNGDYFTFNFTVAPGYTADLDQLRFGAVFNTFGPGPTVFVVRSSVDGFASDLYTSWTAGPNIYTGSPNPLASFDVPLGASFDAVSGNVEFRIVAFNSGGVTGEFGVGNQNGQGGVGDFRLEGNLTEVPEPTALGLIAAVAAMAYCRRGRR